MEYTAVVVDAQTGSEIVKTLTPTEAAELEAAQSQARETEQRWLEEQQAKAAAKESAIAKLSALGLTEDEARAVIGE